MTKTNSGKQNVEAITVGPNFTMQVANNGYIRASFGHGAVQTSFYCDSEAARTYARAFLGIADELDRVWVELAKKDFDGDDVVDDKNIVVVEHIDQAGEVVGEDTAEVIKEFDEDIEDAEELDANPEKFE